MKKIIKTLISALMSVMLLTACQVDINEIMSLVQEYADGTQENIQISGENCLVVSFIDVGQGDSELVQLPTGENMLIDAGDRDSYTAIKAELEENNIEKIDYLIATHPHADHIGSMADVIKNYDIGEIYMPKVTTDTKTYENVLKAVKSKGYTINAAKAGMTVIDSDAIKAEIIAPNTDKYDDLNNYSIVLRLTYKNRSVLFTGDAEVLSENEILKNGYDVSADVLKTGHHGSSTSSGEEFLSAVNPKYAIISCGKGNSYGHPHKETVQKMEKFRIDTFRTDVDGTIIFVTDGDGMYISGKDEIK